MKRPDPPSKDPGWPGLCMTCRHGRIVRGARSTFWRCRLSDTDARFARYPTLPVLACAGHTPMEPDST